MRVVNISDLHAPYHDPYAVELACKVVERVQPDVLIYGGDLLDFYQFSSFDKDVKAFADGMQAAIDQWREIQRCFAQALPHDARQVFIPGNHCDRLRRWICRNSAVYGLRALELAELLGLNEAGIEFCEHELLLANGNLAVRHGGIVRKEAGMSALAELALDRYAASSWSGHTHRQAIVYVRTRRGPVAAIENGCLCQLNPEYVWFPNWQLGISRADIDGDSFLAWNVPFLGSGRELKAIVRGDKVRL